ncbi:MAG TPA: hypothetical protein VMF06_13080 [Candidatus Limnocylindria bacterium]|jgi:hypothetical protein|nr:hypothetical protein [Candidatus Limnocylindria bacterium]
MNLPKRVLWSVVFLLAWVTAQADVTTTNQVAPDVHFIVERLIERLKTPENPHPTNHYRFKRLTSVQEFNRRGETNKNHVTQHRVVVLNGDESAVLELIDNRPPTKKELKADAEDNNPKTDKGHGKHEEEESDGITEEAARCFQYELVATEVIEGRTAYCLAFQPIKGKKVPKSQKFLANLIGKVWVDVSDYEPIRIEAHLREPIELLGGIIGAIKRLEFVIQRRRLSAELWDNNLVEGTFEIRKVFATSRGRFQVRQEDFEILPLESGTR